MRAEIVWAEDVLEILETVRSDELDEIDHDVELLQNFPELRPLKAVGRFRGHRWFPCGNWLIFYKYVDNTIYIRNIWPARIPLPRR